MTAARPLARRLAPAAAAAAAFALLTAAAAGAHAEILPSTGLAGGELYTLSVPNEVDGATTTRVVMNVPEGFSVGLFQPSPGWERDLAESEGVVHGVTWNATAGGTAGALFQFTGSSASPGTFAFDVTQTYSDGTVVDWAGAEGSELPGPVVTTKSSLGDGGGGSSAVALVALAVSAAALVVAIFALVRRGSRESA